MTFCPRNYIIVHFQTHNSSIAPPAMLLHPSTSSNPGGPTHLHIMIHVADISLISSSSQIVTDQVEFLDHLHYTQLIQSSAKVL